jgi:hypothetical protein
MNERHPMHEVPLAFGIPNTLAPLTRRELRGCLVFGGMGLFVLMLGLFPGLRPPPRAALPLALCWLALPAWGLLRFLTRKSRAGIEARKPRTHGTSTQVGLFTLIMVTVGIGFFFWARHLGIASPIIFGLLLLIEGLAGVIISLTEWWRLSHIGLSSGLMAGGFLLPFAGNVSVGIPVGGAVLLGSLLSAAILYGQVRHHEASCTERSASLT